MPEYRCYFLDYRYYVVANRTFTCETDEAACALAEDLLQNEGYPAIEVWEGQRPVYDRKKLIPSDFLR
jgi:hypothetical protein